MKTIINTLVLALVLTTSVSYAGSKPKKESITVLSTKHEVFCFKADKKFLGATIEVYDSNNKMTGKEIVFDRRMIIDFYYLPADTYRIKIMKDNELLEFQFVKE